MPARERAWWGVAGIAVMVYSLLPVGWIVSLSLKAPSELANGRFLPARITGENYATVLDGRASALFLPALRNSLGICLVVTVVSCALAMLAAYAIARLDFPGKKLVLTTALAVAVFPVVSLVTPLLDLWRRVGLYDTWPGLIIPYLSLTLPISIWMLTAFFRQIPWEMEAAAHVDGATSWQAFRKVVVPLAAPGVLTTAVVAFLIAWNDVVLGISLSSTSASRTVPAALGLLPGASPFEPPIGAVSAAAVIITLPVLALVLLFQRRIVAGLTHGAVTG